MIENKEISLKDLPSTIRSRLYRRRGLFPDMTIRTGSIDAVVVFDVGDEKTQAYYRISEKGNDPILAHVTGSTRDVVTESVLRIIFSNEQSHKIPRISMDFKKYGRK